MSTFQKDLYFLAGMLLAIVRMFLAISAVPFVVICEVLGSCVKGSRTLSKDLLQRSL